MRFSSVSFVLVVASVNRQIVCAAGQERFRSLIPSYIRDSTVAVVVYDITSEFFFSSGALVFFVVVTFCSPFRRQLVPPDVQVDRRRADGARQ